MMDMVGEVSPEIFKLLPVHLLPPLQVLLTLAVNWLSQVTIFLKVLSSASETKKEELSLQLQPRQHLKFLNSSLLKLWPIMPNLINQLKSLLRHILAMVVRPQKMHLINDMPLLTLQIIQNATLAWISEKETSSRLTE